MINKYNKNISVKSKQCLKIPKVGLLFMQTQIISAKKRLLELRHQQTQS